MSYLFADSVGGDFWSVRKRPTRHSEPRDLRSELAWLSRALWRKWFVVLSVIVLGCASAVALALSIPPVYTAHASLRIVLPLERGGVAEGGAQLPGDVPILVDSEVEALRSREVLEVVARELDLKTAPGFEHHLIGTGPDGEVRDIDVLTALWEAIDAVGVGASRVISISAESGDPELSAAIANAVVQTHLSRAAEDRRKALTAAVAALDERQRALEAEISERASAVNAVGTAFTLLPEQEAAVLAEERSALQVATSRAEVDLGAATALAERLDAAEAEGSLLSEPAVRGAVEMRILLSEAAAAAAAVEAIAERKGQRGLEMEAALDTRDKTAAAVGAAALAVAQGARAARDRLHAQVAHLRSRSAALDRRIVEARRVLEERARRTRALDAVVAAADRARIERLDIEQRLSVSAALSTPLSAAAPPPQPSGPPRKLIAVAGGVAAVFIGLAAGLAAHTLDRGLRRSEEIEAALGVPVLAAPPRLPRRRGAGRKKGETAPWRARGSAFGSEVMVAALRLAPPGTSAQPPRVLLVTSPLRGDGKTTVTLALGQALLETGRRVVLVGASPDAAARLAAEAGAPCVQSPGGRHDPAEDAPSVAVAAAVPDALSGWSTLLADLRGRFDFILIDGPEVSAGSAVAPLAALADGVAVVLRKGRSSPESLAACLKRLDSVGSRPTGVLLNHV